MDSGQANYPDGSAQSNGEQHENTCGPGRSVASQERNIPNRASCSLGKDEPELLTKVSAKAEPSSDDPTQDPDTSGEDSHAGTDDGSDVNYSPEPQRSEEEAIQELMRRGASLFALFDQSNAVDHINEAIDCCESVVNLLPESHAGKPSTLSNLGCAYLSRFEHLNDVEDLNKAIDCGVRAALLTEDSDEDKTSILTNLGNSYRTRFLCLGQLIDLSKAIDYGRQAVSLAPDGCLGKLNALCNLGDSYFLRFRRWGALVDLNQAVDCGTRALSLTQDGHPVRVPVLNDLGSTHHARFDCPGELVDVDKAIKYMEQAALLVPDGHAIKPTILDNLGSSYRARYERLGGLVDLNKAVVYGLRAVLLAPDSRFNKPDILGNLGDSYIARFNRVGDISDVNNAIGYGVQAVSLVPDGHAAKPGLLSKLGNSHRIRFERLGEQADLNKAIDYGLRVIPLTPDGHAAEPGQLSCLGMAYLVRFEHLGELSDLNKAIECEARAVSLTPDDRVVKASMLSNLGRSYQSRFCLLGELSDLNRAIDYKKKAVLLTPDSHVNKPGQLSNLAGSYLTLFERLGELEDLNKAVEYGAMAISLTPDNHPSKLRTLNNLGNTYQTRFERLGELLDLDKAIDCGARAISLAPNGHPDMPTLLTNLGIAYRTRFDLFGEECDSNKAIDYMMRADLLISDGHANKSGQLGNLAGTYLIRFAHFGELEDLNKVIEYGSRAVSMTPDGHALKPGHLTNLANGYIAQYKISNKISDCELAITCLKDAALSLGGPPFFRFRACQEWARLADLHTISSPCDAYHQAFKLLPQLVWIGTTLHRRYCIVANLSSFATEAACYAIRIGNLGLALEWLEAGRSIVWGQIAQLRTPFDQLSTHNPKLASKLNNISHRLERAGSRSTSAQSLETDGSNLVEGEDNHIQLALSWDECLDEARAIPGFENFLQTPQSSRLLDAAVSHPIVVVNVHKSRCDALILQRNGVSHICLNKFSIGTAIAAREHISSLVGYRRPLEDHEYDYEWNETRLEDLWTGAVKPVLDSLGYRHRLPVDQLPHLTWCTTGLLSFLPLHASGPNDPSCPSTFDLVVSSYTPTISALLQSQSTADCQSGILAVGQEHTPDLPRLLFVDEELKVIRKHAKAGSHRELKDDQATVGQVLQSMDQFSWVHMACHGSQDAKDATQSAFHLYNGKLTLAALSKQSFENKGLAFLSACHTATGDKTLSEEAVHLAAGMLMAGYPSVIGTMWSIKDKDGPLVADKVYEELIKDGKMDHTKAAKALHRAVAHLREQKDVGAGAIARWAPFIHVGC